MVFEGPAWNNVTVAQIRLAKAHCETVLFSTFANTVGQLASGESLQPATCGALGRLCILFGLSLLEAGLGDLLEDGYMTGRSDCVWGSGGGPKQRGRGGIGLEGEW